MVAACEDDDEASDHPAAVMLLVSVALHAAQLKDEHVKDDLDVLVELQYSTAACIRICRFNVRLDFLSVSTVRCQVP
jgi:hypothetical protein